MTKKKASKKITTAPEIPPEELDNLMIGALTLSDALTAIAEVRKELTRVCLQVGHRQKLEYSHTIEELESGVVDTEK